MVTKAIRRRQPQIAAAILLILCMSVAFCVTSQHISSLATESCFRELRQSTHQLCRELRKNVEGTQKILMVSADQIARFDAPDSQETRQLLSSFQEGELISRLELLLPNDKVLQADGSVVNVEGVLSFAKEAALGIHISHRSSDLGDRDRFILRSYVPVVQNGQTVAMLYGVMDLAHIADYYAAEPLGEGLRLHLIESKSGNFLLNTMHNTLGNTQELRTRQPKPGYTVEQVISDLAAGRSGRTAFVSTSIDDCFYCDYAPVGINDWMVMVTIPESLALADANQIRSTLYFLAGLEAVILIAYFLWLLNRTKRDAVEKENQLNHTKYILDIESTLFGAARNPALIETALQKVAKVLSAEGSFFLVRRPLQETQAFFYHPSWDGIAREELTNCFLSMSQRIETRDGVVSYDPAALLQKIPPAQTVAHRLDIRSVMFLPVLDAQGVVIGAFGAVNLERRWTDTSLLESVILSFLTALNHLESFRMVQEMGLMDHLTGLLNRNSFQQTMERLEQDTDDTLACVYVDVDGLHEFNNQCGHMSGDQMLQEVASTLKAAFGPEHTYRIGGDEFVVFAIGLEAETVQTKVLEAERTLATHGYHISVGVEWRRNVPLVYELVRQAEAKMYAAKRCYYAEIDEADLARERNRQLEALLTEKQDLDAFRSVLSSQYKGVYIVNLSLDTMRPIYIPSYFAILVEEAGGKFSRALRQYVTDNVQPEYQDLLHAFMDYTQVKTWLDQGKTPALRYQKQDGSSILLKIFPCPDYSNRLRECIWIFGDLDAKG